MAVRFDVFPVANPAELRQHTPDWQEFLRDETVRGGIYCDPVYVEQTMSFGDGHSLVLVTGVEDGRRCCLIPFRRRRRRLPILVGPWKVPSISTRVAHLPDYAFPVRGDRDRLGLIREAIPFLRDAMASDVIHVENTPTDGPDGGEHAPGSWRFRNRQTTYLITFPADYASFWSALGSRVREGLKRRTRKLRQECHDAVFLKKYTLPGNMAELHAHMMTIWTRSWHANFNSGRPLGLASLERLAAEGWIRAYVLVANDRPIAYLAGYQYRETYYYDSLAFDAEWRTLAPGTVLNYLLFEELFATEPPRELDFGSGYNEYKEHLGNVPQERANLWVPLTRRGRMALAVKHTGERASMFAADTLQDTRVYKWLRNRVRQVDQSRAT